MLDNMVDDLPSSLTVKLRETLQKDEKVLIALKGAFKEALVCTDRRVMVLKSGFMTGNTFGANIFQLPYGSVTSAEVKFGALSGYFELSTGGMQNTKKSYWTNDGGNGDAKAAPNSVSIVDRKQADRFRAAASVIVRKINEPSYIPTPLQSAGPSLADQLAKLAELTKEGFVTREEFEQQKAALLEGAVKVSTASDIISSEIVEPSAEDDSKFRRLDAAFAEANRQNQQRQAGALKPVPARAVFGRRK